MARCYIIRAAQQHGWAGLGALNDIPLSLYIHFPWCVKKCPYCDFNSHTRKGELPEQAYVDALIQDFSQQINNIGQRKIQTIFIGGGTPSLISATQINRLLETLRQSNRLQDDIEITLEANPGAIDASHFDAYLAAGVNRLSIGVQSLNDDSLKQIGRIHSVKDTHQAIERAHTAGFKRINLDIMYGLPEQNLQASKQDIEQAIALSEQYNIRHLSVYQLTIEPNTEFAVRPPKLPDSEQYWDMQLQAQALLQSAEFTQYEVSAYSQEDQCQHNLNYWHFGDYLAIGAGAHGKLSKLDSNDTLVIERYWNHRHPNAYLKASQAASFIAKTKAVPNSDIDFEYLMNALRLKQGFALSDYASRTHHQPKALIDKLSSFIEQGYLESNLQRIWATQKGYQYLDTILVECLPEPATKS